MKSSIIMSKHKFDENYTFRIKMCTVVVETNKNVGQQNKHVNESLRRPEILIFYENAIFVR